MIVLHTKCSMYYILNDCIHTKLNMINFPVPFNYSLPPLGTRTIGYVRPLNFRGTLVGASHTLNVWYSHFIVSIDLVNQKNRMTDGAKLTYPRVYRHPSLRPPTHAYHTYNLPHVPSITQWTSAYMKIKFKISEKFPYPPS